VFDSSLERYARSDARGKVTVHQAGDGRELLALPEVGVPAWVLLFSPDGRHLAAKHHAAGNDSGNRLLLWDLTQPREKPREIGSVHAAALAFSPDSKTLAVGTTDAVQLVETSSGQVRTRLALRAAPHRLAFHPDGRRLAVASLSQPAVRLLDVETEKVVESLSLPAGARGLAWHPEGRQLAIGDGDFNVWLWEPGGTPVRLRGHQAEVTD